MTSGRKGIARVAPLSMVIHEAIDAILQDASPRDVLMPCARALADVAPNCCEAHQDEFKAEFLRVLGDCIAIRQERESAEADEDEDDDAHRQVH
jgi:hypothetical protein